MHRKLLLMAGLALAAVAGCEAHDPPTLGGLTDAEMAARLHAGRLAEVAPTAQPSGLTPESATAANPAGSTEAAESPDSGASARTLMDLVVQRVELDAVPPPQAARLFGYTAVAIYEATSALEPGYLSLSGQLNDMPAIPEPGPEVTAPGLAAAAAIEAVGTRLFDTTDSYDAFQHQLLTAFDLDPGDSSLALESAAWGQRVGHTIATWAEADGYHEIQDLPYRPPVGDGLWEPTAPNQAALQPYWAMVRPFALPASDACRPVPPPDFSLDEGSQFWAEVMTVYETTQTLTGEEQAIAEFWADNPGSTGTPPGHWISIVGIVTSDLGLDLTETAEAYALTGIALADAFISTWDEKYRSNLIRPVTVINRHIDPDWQAHVSTPPFPEYTSGHSVASGAAATVLTDLFGDLTFEDTTHVQRGVPARTFGSFEEAAEEAAISRLYGGIHYPAAIEEGLEQGACVGEWVAVEVQTRE